MYSYNFKRLGLICFSWFHIKLNKGGIGVNTIQYVSLDDIKRNFTNVLCEAKQLSVDCLGPRAFLEMRASMQKSLIDEEQK